MFPGDRGPVGLHVIPALGSQRALPRVAIDGKGLEARLLAVELEEHPHDRGVVPLPVGREVHLDPNLPEAAIHAQVTCLSYCRPSSNFTPFCAWPGIAASRELGSSLEFCIGAAR